MNGPEYANIAAFLAFCADDERTEFTVTDLQALNFRTGERVQVIAERLRRAGLTLAYREPEKRVRGFGSNDNDRWYGPGAERTYGGSGFDNKE